MRKFDEGVGLTKSKTHFNLSGLEFALEGLTVEDSKGRKPEPLSVSSLGYCESNGQEVASGSEYESTEGKSLFAQLDEVRSRSMLEHQQTPNAFYVGSKRKTQEVISQPSPNAERTPFSFK